MPYFLHRCPECRFVTYEEEFDELSETGSEEDLPRDSQNSGIKRYSDAAAHYATRREQALRIADTFMRAGWGARQERRVDEERALLREATRWLTNALDERTVESDQRARVTYLAGELYRRCEKFAEAERLFEQARSELIDG